MNILDICIVSGADFVPLHSYVNHSVYAREFGYDFRFEAGVAEAVENVFFFKTAAIERVIKRYDWVVWMDDETFVTDFSRDRIRDLIDEAEATGVSFIVASGPEEPNGFFSMLNSGVMLLKNCPENVEMLGTMNDESLARARAWWDDGSSGSSRAVTKTLSTGCSTTEAGFLEPRSSIIASSTPEHTTTRIRSRTPSFATSAGTGTKHFRSRNSRNASTRTKPWCRANLPSSTRSSA